jgi:hypothetical protein
MALSNIFLPQETTFQFLFLSAGSISDNPGNIYFDQGVNLIDLSHIL